MKSIPILLLITLVIAGAWALSRRHSAPPSVSGTIEVDEVHVASRYGGRVEKLHVQEGDTLREGDVIAELDAAELRANRDMAAAQLEELTQGPRPAEIEAAKRDWEALQAQLEYARADARRAEELLKNRVMSPAEMQRAVSSAEAMEKNVDAARQRYELLREGTRPERLAQARARVDEIEAQLREMKITAPGDSVVEVLSVKIGDVLAANRELATLILPQHLWVRVYIPEPWLARVKRGNKVTVRVDGWPGREFRGEVEQINRTAEFTPRNVQTVEDRVKQVFGVKIRLNNSEDALRAGMSADVFFPEAPRN